MEYRQFGRTDLRVSAIGFGCWEISGSYGAIDAQQFDVAVHRALDAGINCFDTAEAYGMGVSEQALGRALGNRRDEVCLVTKVGVGYPEAPNRRDGSRTRIMASIERSLRAYSSEPFSRSRTYTVPLAAITSSAPMIATAIVLPDFASPAT